MTTTIAPGALGAPVHPRFEQRATEVKDEHRQRRSRAALFIASVLVIVLVAAGLTRTGVLDVDDVRVLGARNLSSDVIRTAAAIGESEPLVELDTTVVAERIASLAWVDEASVSKTMSGEVTIEVQERTPAVLIRTPDTDQRAATDVLVDASGRVLSVAWRGQLPEVQGERSRSIVPVEGVVLEAHPGHWVDGRLLSIVEAIAALPASITDAADEVVVTDRGLELHLGGAGAVVLGDGRDIEQKIWSLRSFVATVDLTCLTLLDLRAPSVPVMTRQPDC